MERILNFEPKKVFTYFEDLTRIPRGSGNEKEVSDYLVEFAKTNNLEYIQDEYMNVIIKKPATPSYESLPAVILQGHMDMVNEKNNDKVHDFDKDPLTLKIVGDDIYADETTLGADNGIAVAMAMSILASSDVAHPALEAVFTVEEETGLVGALKLDGSKLDGKYLINIDSEEEGELLVSCAGGSRIKLILPVSYTDVDSNRVDLKVSVKGLYGGHSGMDIIKGRGNANKLIGRILDSMITEGINFELFNVNGGSKMNAIPREADAVIAVNSSDKAKVEALISKWNDILKNELRGKDDNVQVVVSEIKQDSTKVFDENSKLTAIATLMMIPNGIMSMSHAIENLVESSVNLGVLTTTDSSVSFECAPRSSVGSLKEAIRNQYKALAYLVGAELVTDSDYPEWQYNPDSKLRTHFEKVYKDMYNKDSKVVAIHAGVECGLFKEKLPELDMISIGPNMADVHTPNEHVSISSIQRTYSYLLEVLKRFNEIER